MMWKNFEIIWMNPMKKIALYLILSLLLGILCGCGAETPAQIAATTAPVWEFTSRLCRGTPLTVSRLVTENVSCLHDYSLSVRQMKMTEQAELVVLSGAGLEEFMEDLLTDKAVIDCSAHISLLEPEGGHHHEETESHEGHHHEHDPHIWLSPANAAIMAQNICDGLSARYPEYESVFGDNLASLQAELLELQRYGEEQLSDLSCRELITFHDGFGYLADAFRLEILHAIEEESGSEASARELIGLIEEVEHHNLPAIFTEINGSPAAASVIRSETGVNSYPLDMAMGEQGYFDAMYHNIDTLKEALQ